MPARFLNYYFRMSGSLRKMFWQYRLLVATSATVTVETASSFSAIRTTLSTSTSSRVTAYFWPTFLDINGTSCKILAIHFFDSFLGFILSRH